VTSGGMGKIQFRQKIAFLKLGIAPEDSKANSA
jgi:hypothetical protein